MRVGVAELQAGLLVLDDAVGEEVERASEGETAPSQALERVKPYTSRTGKAVYTLETSEYTNELCKPTWDPTSFTPRQRKSVDNLRNHTMPCQDHPAAQR